MMKYLKSEIGVIKINTETKESLSVWDDANSKRIVYNVLDESTFGLMTVIKVEEGFFTEITEEEFLTKKEEVKAAIMAFGF